MTKTMTTKRYYVAPIDGNEHAGYTPAALGSSLSEHDDYALAKGAACGAAYDHHYGTAVVDRVDEWIDWGDEWTNFAGEDIARPKLA
jgi:hypothetical protein